MDWRLRIGVECGDAGKVGGIGTVTLRPANWIILSEGTIGSKEYRVGQCPSPWAPIDVWRGDEATLVPASIPSTVRGPVA